MTSISPDSIVAGSGSITLTVTGSGFVASSIVNWNGAALTTGYVSATELTATVPAFDLAAAGSANVTVTSPAPGGGTSTAAVFSITGSNPAPTITSVAPASVWRVLTHSRDGQWHKFRAHVGGPLEWRSPSNCLASAAQITAQIPAADITTSGAASITVTNPAPGGGTSTAGRSRLTTLYRASARCLQPVLVPAAPHSR